MSQFDFPRIHVNGQFYFNPGTANNDSIDPTESGALTGNTEMVQPVSGGKSDEEFRTWLISIDHSKNFLNGQWNIYGDMTLWFQNVKVNSVQIDAGNISTDATEYPIIGSEVTINNAFAIDVNPEGFSSTQVFCDSFSIKGLNDNAVGGKRVWESHQPSRGATRWINWYRNVSHHGLKNSSGAAGGVSATWQMAFPIMKQDLERELNKSDKGFLDGNLRAIYDEYPKSNDHGKKLQGMIFRMNVYLCSPLISDTDLHDKYFSKGIAKENPAVGRIVGTFAPWFEDEMTSITLSRFLNSAAPFSHNGQARKAYLAPALAYVNKTKSIISLDLSNTFPEDGKEGEKFMMGTASLQYQNNNGGLETIGNFEYDRENYELTGGLVDVNYDNSKLADIENGLLAVSLSNYNKGPLLLEDALMIATDNSCVYLNEGSNKNRKIEIRACYKGGPLQKEVYIYIDQWKATPTNLQPLIPLCLERALHSIPSSGILEYELKTLEGPGVRVFRFVDKEVFDKVIPDTKSSPKKLNVITDFMCCARVLPENDYSWVKDDDLNFDLIYQEILRYYYLLLPAMNKFLPMNEKTVWNNSTVAQYVLSRSQEDQWDKFHYMPRTRDLSDGKRKLLHRFCEKLIKASLNAK